MAKEYVSGFVNNSWLMMRKKTNGKIINGLMEYHDELMAGMPEIDDFIGQFNKYNTLYGKYPDSVSSRDTMANDETMTNLFRRMSEIYSISTIAKILTISREWIYQHGVKSNFAGPETLTLSEQVLQEMSIKVDDEIYVLNSTDVARKFQISPGRAQRLVRAANSILKPRGYISERSREVVSYMLEHRDKSIVDVARDKDISYSTAIMLRRRYIHKKDRRIRVSDRLAKVS